MKKLILLAASAIITLSANAQNAYLDYCNAGDACVNNQDYKGAIENYVKALELDADHQDYTTAMQLGTCYEQTEEWQKAGDAYKESYLRGNYDAGVINNMRRCYETAQCTDCIKSGYLEIAAAYPDQAPAMAKRLYNIYVKEGDNAKCLECTETMLTDPELTDENRLKYLKNAASFALKMDSIDIAQSYYDKVLEIVPDDPDIHKAIGTSLYNQIKKNKKHYADIYEAKKKAGSKHPLQDYADMNKGIKPVTMKYAPIAIEHLKIVTAQQPDAELTKMINDLYSDMAVFTKK